MLTTEEAAKSLGISVRALRYYVTEGEVRPTMEKCNNRAGYRYLYSEADVQRAASIVKHRREVIDANPTLLGGKANLAQGPKLGH
jgi:DNA-binding transcriptional MerR regulator